MFISPVWRVYIYIGFNTDSHLLNNIHYKFLIDLIDANGESLRVYALGEMTHANKLNQLPSIQILFLCTELHSVLFKPVLIPAETHCCKQSAQEVLELLQYKDTASFPFDIM